MFFAARTLRTSVRKKCNGWHLVKCDFAASGSAGVNPLLGLEVAATTATTSATPVTTTATPEASTSTCAQWSRDPADIHDF